MNKYDLVMKTDGSCRNNGRSNAKAGCGVEVVHGSVENKSEPLPSHYRPTNQTAELHAVKEALDIAIENARGPSLIQTDSTYTRDCINSYRNRWENNGFRTATGGEVANQGLIRDIYHRVDICEQRGTPATVTHIPREHNQVADGLARGAAEQYGRSDRQGDGRHGSSYNDNRQASSYSDRQASSSYNNRQGSYNTRQGGSYNSRQGSDGERQSNYNSRGDSYNDRHDSYGALRGSSYSDYPASYGNRPCNDRDYDGYY